MTYNKLEVSTSSSYTYIPAYGDSGVHGITIEVSDGKDIDEHKWAVLVKTARENIALGKETTASTGDAWKVNDNDRGSSWRIWFDTTPDKTTETISEENLQWVEIDLGEAQTVDRVDVYAYKGYCGNGNWCGQDYSIEYSNDEESWTTVASNTNAGDTNNVFDAVEARYWRLVITEGLYDYRFIVYEIMMYNS